MLYPCVLSWSLERNLLGPRWAGNGSDARQSDESLLAKHND